VIDATAGVTPATPPSAATRTKSGRSVIIAVNKWDARNHWPHRRQTPADRVIFEEQLRKSLKYLSYATVIFLSAKEGHGMSHVVEGSHHRGCERRKRVTTGQMNRFLDKIDFQRAPVPMAKRIRIFYMTQAAVAPPTFVLFTDRQVQLHFAFGASSKTRFAPPLASRAPPSGSR